jgi:D-alanyl-D-alanine endopeptidase (penicillin-binding protein 7)
MSRNKLNWKTLVPLLGLAVSCASCAQSPATPHGEETRARLDFNSCPKPVYPRDELAAGHEGKVTLQFRVDAAGAVNDSKIDKSSGFPALDEAARDALAKCSFKPATADGRPVAAWTQVQYVWTH